MIKEIIITSLIYLVLIPRIYQVIKLVFPNIEISNKYSFKYFSILISLLIIPYAVSMFALDLMGYNYLIMSNTIFLFALLSVCHFYLQFTITQNKEKV